MPLKMRRENLPKSCLDILLDFNVSHCERT